jgi:hypothetical protein
LRTLPAYASKLAFSSTVSRGRWGLRAWGE